MAYGKTWQQSLYYHAPFWLKNLIASGYGWRQKRERYGMYYRDYLLHLLASQWHTNAVLAEYQLAKVQQFLRRAQERSPFYRARFQACDFDPAKMQSLADLTALPTLSKDTLREHLAEVIADNLQSLNARWGHTSGTTGTGLRFPLSRECFQREHAFHAVHYGWSLFQPGEAFAYCSGHPVAHYDRHTPPFWVHDYANNWLLMSSYHLTERNLPHYIGALERFQPVILAGYPSSIYLLALANRYLGQRVQPRAIYTESETLFEFQRQAIEQSFGCKVFMWYGNSEMCANIVECDQGKYHLKLEHSYVELLDTHDRPVASGQEGHMVCTAFGNNAMPLVRYRIEDIAVFAPTEVTCACGRGGTLVERVVGRAEDYVLTPDGRFVGRLDHLFKDAVHVKLAQIVQPEVNEVILRIVKTPAYTSQDEYAILEQARVRLGSTIAIHVDYIDDIERTNNGKFRFIVSKIDKSTIDTTLQSMALN
jgi:phenylacetate-CoA ligase